MDELIRAAAFQWVEKQVNLHGGFIPRKLLDEGFEFQGQRITLTGPQGIWKPASMELPLSIYTRPDGPYSDQIMDGGFLVYRIAALTLTIKIMLVCVPLCSGGYR